MKRGKRISRSKSRVMLHNNDNDPFMWIVMCSCLSFIQREREISPTNQWYTLLPPPTYSLHSTPPSTLTYLVSVYVINYRFSSHSSEVYYDYNKMTHDTPHTHTIHTNSYLHFITPLRNIPLKPTLCPLHTRWIVTARFVSNA